MIKRNIQKFYEWKRRTATRLKRSPIKSQRAPKRRTEETAYRKAIGQFLREHPTCPVTGEQTTQIHHSAKREGAWLNLQRYWIAVSSRGHEIIEANKRWASKVGLMVRIKDDYTTHVNNLVRQGVNLLTPIFYVDFQAKCDRIKESLDYDPATQNPNL